MTKKMLIGCLFFAELALFVQPVAASGATGSEKVESQIKKIVQNQIVLSDDDYINSFADGSVSSYVGEEYGWQKEILLLDRKITMVVIYNSESTCTDELFGGIPRYLTFVDEVELNGRPVRFYSVNKKIKKFKKKSIGKLDFGRFLVKSERDNFWMGENRLKIEYYPSMKFKLSKNIKAHFELKIKRISNCHNEVKRTEFYRAFLEFNNIMNSPFNAVVGRQELSFGRKFLMGEWEDPYDAALVTYNNTPFKVSLFAGTRTRSLWDFTPDIIAPDSPDRKDRNVMEKTEKDFYSSVYGINCAVGSKPSKIEGYVFHRDSGFSFLHTTAIGLRAERDLTDWLSINAEVAKQFSREMVLRDDGYRAGIEGVYNRRGIGGYVQAVSKCRNIVLTPEFRLEYAYLSKNFDLMSGDNLYSDIKWGRVRNVRRNMQVINFGTILHPLKDLELKVFYSIFRKINHDKNWVTSFTWLSRQGKLSWVRRGDYYKMQPTGSRREGTELDIEMVYHLGRGSYISCVWGKFWTGHAYDSGRVHSEYYEYYLVPKRKNEDLFEISFNYVF